MICIITLNGSVCDKYSNIFEYSLPNTEYLNKIIEICTNKYFGLWIPLLEQVAMAPTKSAIRKPRGSYNPGMGEGIEHPLSSSTSTIICYLKNYTWFDKVITNKGRTRKTT